MQDKKTFEIEYHLDELIDIFFSIHQEKNHVLDTYDHILLCILIYLIYVFVR